MTFRDATAVTRVDERRFTGEIQPNWDVLGNANGGYLMAIATRAASAAAGGRFPASITAHFTAPGRPGPVTVDTDVVKEGRQFTTVRATLCDEQRTLAVLLGSFGAEPSGDHPIERIQDPPPSLPPPEACFQVEPADTFPPPLAGQVDLRLPKITERRSSSARVQGWFRLRDGEPFDAASLLVAVDAFPPAIFFAQMPMRWTPTLELTAHLRRLPEGEWLKCAFSSRFISDGYVEEDGEVWDESGGLVAQSRQLALIGRP